MSVFENGMQRVGSSFAMLIKAALAQSKKRNQQKNEVKERELQGQEKVEQQSKADDSLVLGRNIVNSTHIKLTTASCLYQSIFIFLSLIQNPSKIQNSKY